MRYWMYLRCLYMQRHWKLLFNMGDLLMALLGIVLIIIVTPERIARIIERTSDSFMVGMLVFISSGIIFGAVGFVKKALNPEKNLLLKTIGFRRFDFFLLTLHTFMLSSVVFSELIRVMVSHIFYEFDFWFTVAFFAFQVLAVNIILHLMSSERRCTLVSVKNYRCSDKLLSNKYFAFALKDLSKIRRHPVLLFDNILVAIAVWIMLLTKANYILSLYLICAFIMLSRFELYSFDVEYCTLYRFIRLKRCEVFRFRFATFIVINIVAILVYTCLYYFLINSFSIWMIAGFLILMVFVTIQHATLEIICSSRFPRFEMYTMEYLFIWIAAVLPGSSFAMNIFALQKLKQLKAELVEYA